MTHHPYTRILSLEVRYRRFGFAILEGKPMRLLDVGTRTFVSAAAIPQRLAPLISTFDPCAIIVRRPAHKQSSHLNGVKANLRAILAEAEKRSIQVESMTVHEVRCAFRDIGVTKDSIAVKITQIFPELHWKLPPRRKPWMSEGHNMVIFDATATGLTYLTRSDKKGIVT
jgi:hypothetical protein